LFRMTNRTANESGTERGNQNRERQNQENTTVREEPVNRRRRTADDRNESECERKKNSNTGDRRRMEGRTDGLRSERTSCIPRTEKRTTERNFSSGPGDRGRYRRTTITHTAHDRLLRARGIVRQYSGRAGGERGGGTWQAETVGNGLDHSVGRSQLSRLRPIQSVFPIDRAIVQR